MNFLEVVGATVCGIATMVGGWFCLIVLFSF